MTPGHPAHRVGTDRAAGPGKQPAGIRLDMCPLCKSRRLAFHFASRGIRIERCRDCDFVLSNPQPSDRRLGEIYSASYFLGEPTTEGTRRVESMKAATARLYLDSIARYRGGATGRLLEIGCGQGELLVEAEARGYEVTGVEYSPSAVAIAQGRLRRGVVHCGELHHASLESNGFDVCVLCDVIEHVRDVRAFLAQVRGLLRPSGTLFIATPSLDSWSARTMGPRWMEFKEEHLSYFSTESIRHALNREGFEAVIVGRGWKILSLDYVAHHFARYPVAGVTAITGLLNRLCPARLRQANVKVVASGMMVHAKPAPAFLPRATPRLSVIVPAYNEAGTFSHLMDALLAKEIPGIDIEVMLVESNSTDGTREQAVKYGSHPRVRLILEDQPRGKGHAIRAGFPHATGDVILIQDADLEYDLDDYETLIEPLFAGRVSFVLGARHGGSTLKLRQFANQPWLGGLLNFGHLFFTTLVNLLFGLRLKDPFTMFKVFRRDCLAGLHFDCNRFDFDYELLIQLVRKGYRPIEVPVNYRSRSFREGKKVRMFRDPLTWLWALARLRLARIDPIGNLGQQRPPDKTVVRKVA